MTVPLPPGFDDPAPTPRDDIENITLPDRKERLAPGEPTPGGLPTPLPGQFSAPPGPRIFRWTIIGNFQGRPVTYEELREALRATNPDGSRGIQHPRIEGGNLFVNLPRWNPNDGSVNVSRSRLERLLQVANNLLLTPDDVEFFPGTFRDFEDPALRGGGGFGGGSGARFVAPDSRLVEDAVKATLVALVGTSDQGRVSMLTDIYMNEAKRAFKRRDKEQIDPMASVREKIRTFTDYKAIHDLRPESMDEFQWVSDRRGAMIRAGVAPTLAEDAAITSAKAGATVPEAARAGEVQSFNRTGSFLPGIFQSMRTSARAAARLL